MISTTKGYNKDKFADGHDCDYITRTIFNRGIYKTVRKTETLVMNPAGTFSLELMTCTAFYRERNWYAGQFVRMITPKYEEIKTVWQFFEAIFHALQPKMQSVLVREVDSVFSSGIVILPLVDGVIDWKMIANYITAQEKLAIQRMDAWRQKEIEAAQTILS